MVMIKLRTTGRIVDEDGRGKDEPENFYRTGRAEIVELGFISTLSMCLRKGEVYELSDSLAKTCYENWLQERQKKIENDQKSRKGIKYFVKKLFQSDKPLPSPELEPKKGNLDERLLSLIERKGPDKLRRFIQIASKTINATNEEIGMYILGSKREQISNGLAQSLLYNREGIIKNFYGFCAGAGITSSESGLTFEGEHAGYGAKFEGNNSGVNCTFEGRFAGAETIFEGENAGKNSKFTGNYAGTNVCFWGKNAGQNVEFHGIHEGAGIETTFDGENAGSNSIFEGRGSGYKAMFNGRYAGQKVVFKHNGLTPTQTLCPSDHHAGYGAEFFGEEAGKDVEYHRLIPISFEDERNPHKNQPYLYALERPHTTSKRKVFQ